MDRLTIDGDRLRQSIINTQVHDGFYVKQTNSFNDTVAYLTLMTRYLQSRYRNTTFVSAGEIDLREDAEEKDKRTGQRQRDLILASS